MLSVLPVIHNKDYRVHRNAYLTYLKGLHEGELHFAQFTKDRVTNWL